MGYYDTISIHCKVPDVDEAVEVWEYMQTADALLDEGSANGHHWTEYWTQDGDPTEGGGPLYLDEDGHVQLEEPVMRNLRIDPHVSKLCEWAQALGVDLWIEGLSESHGTGTDALWAWAVEDGDIHRYEAKWVQVE